MEKIVIDPVTRIEGHAKITIQLDEQKQVEHARLHVTQFRGFEKFCEGRPFHEMPALTARTCGICPVSHLVASSKACDALLAVQIPQTGIDLRRVINLAQILQSHALNFFHLSAPDFIFGFDAEPEMRNIFKVAEHYPETAKEGIRLRAIGQKIIETLGGKRIHPNWIVPGGVSHKVEPHEREAVLKMLPEAKQIIKKTLGWFKGQVDQFSKEIEAFGNFESLYLSIIGTDGVLEHYDGLLRVMDAEGKILESGVVNERYDSIIGEAVENDSYLKSPFYKPLGVEKGMYRVGPLARLNIAQRTGFPESDTELENFKSLGRGRPVSASFYYHYARLIEMLYAVECMESLMGDEAILSDHIRAFASPNAMRGVGVSEAPRGTLFHDYRIDRNGLLTDINMIIATGNNAMAMNASVTQVAKQFVNGVEPRDGDLNRVEAVIRAFDPCLSCSTHAQGMSGVETVIVDAYGNPVECERF